MPTPVDGSVDSLSSEHLNGSAASSKESFEEPIETADDLTPADPKSFDQSEHFQLSVSEVQFLLKNSESASFCCKFKVACSLEVSVA